MKRFKGIVLVVVAMLLGATYLLPALSANAQSSASLSIVPKKNYVIEPGKSVKDTIVIRNLDSVQPLELSLRVVDFTFTDDGGTPKLMLDESAPQTTWSLRPFLTVPQNVSIPPSSSQTLNISVAIPANQGAGSYYSAIIYSSGSGTGAGNVGLSASGATLVFTSIPGKVKEDLSLKKFGAYDIAANGNTSGYMFVTDKEPQSIGYTLQNNGNVTESPVGSIKLRDMFGREQTIDNVNPSGSLALIGQTRTYTTCIKLAPQTVDFNGVKTSANSCTSPGLWPGYYHATLDLFYGQNGNNTQEITGVASFWYLPLWFIIVLAIVILALAFVVWRVVTKIRTALYGPKTKKRLHRR
ncbi:MAG: hypothetical protein JWO99_808 [Candidatus Saccharibacteria bacterium]|nr:hypothetical protein [Candidatus Saccharibacteria bacterium]